MCVSSAGMKFPPVKLSSKVQHYPRTLNGEPALLHPTRPSSVGICTHSGNGNGSEQPNPMSIKTALCRADRFRDKPRKEDRNMISTPVITILLPAFLLVAVCPTYLTSDPENNEGTGFVWSGGEKHLQRLFPPPSLISRALPGPCNPSVPDLLGPPWSDAHQDQGMARSVRRGCAYCTG